METLLEFDACTDIPDERDYHYSEICGSSDLPEEFSIDDMSDYQNQGLEELTGYMCVFFSTTHGCNILNFLENLKEKHFLAKDLGLYAKDLGLLNVKTGAAIQSGPKCARDKKWINSWFLVNESNIKQAIFDGHPIVVGSNQLDFSGIILKEKKGYGHAILIIGWNKDGYIIKESYGKEKWDNGRQILPYSLFDKLYPSKYALIDEENPLITYKKKIMENISITEAKKAFELGIWSGLNPKNNASREEVAAMILRAVDKFKKGEI